MANPFKAIWGVLKKLFTRPGLNQFLEQYIEVAQRTLLYLREVHSNADFHEWKDEAWLRIREATGQFRGNWISILIALAFEELKAKGKIS